MVDLLVLVQRQDVVDRRVSRPDQIEVLSALQLLESAEFHRIDDGIVDMRSIRIEECHEQVLDVASPLVGLYGVRMLLRVHLLYVRRVREESSRRSALEVRFHELDIVIRGLEDAIRQSAFLALQECRAHWIFQDELFDLVVDIHVPFFLFLPLVEPLYVLLAQQWILIEILLFFCVSHPARIRLLFFGLLSVFESSQRRIVHVRVILQFRFPVLAVTAILAIVLPALISIIVEVAHV